MRSFVLNLTNRCNFKCEHCFREDASKEDLALPLLERCLPTLRVLGVQLLAFTGGEPILHPQFPQIVRRCAESGFRLGVVTNGSATERYLEALAPHRDHVAYVALSLDGATAETHDGLRHHRGSFHDVLASITALRRAGYPVNISHVLSKRTAKVTSLLALAELLADRDIAALTIGAVVPAPRNGAVRVEAPPVGLAAALAVVRRKLANRVRVTPALGHNAQIAFCSNLATMNDAALRYDGEVVFCCDCVAGNPGASLGNVQREPLLDILARHSAKASQILAARVTAMVSGDSAHRGDCAFCNQVLAQCAAPPRDAAPTTTRLQVLPPEPATGACATRALRPIAGAELGPTPRAPAEELASPPPGGRDVPRADSAL